MRAFLDKLKAWAGAALAGFLAWMESLKPEQCRRLEWTCVTLIFAMPLCAMAVSCNGQRAAKAEQAKAVKAGVGRWVADPATGVVSFQYGPEK